MLIVEQLRDQISLAFPATPFYGPITACHCEECADITQELRHKRWDEISTAFLDLTCGPTLLTPEAFCSFLPAYLLRALDDLSPDAIIVEFTVYSLCPNQPDEDDPQPVYDENRVISLLRRVQLMSREQIHAVRAFLVFVQDNAGNADLLAVSIAAGSAQQPPKEIPRALTMTISRFKVDNQSFEDALQTLAVEAGGTFVIGLETTVPPKSAAPLRLSLENPTVEEVLKIMCATDGRYAFTEIQPGLIEVRPLEEPPAIRAVMDLSVNSLDIQVRQWPWNLYARLPELVPELGGYLYSKTMEWARQTGRPPPGTAGVIMSTNVSPPLISMKLRSTTVRGVLNAIAVYTLQHGSTDRSSPTYLRPAGWRVDFVPYPQAATGLGGYLRWSSFP